MFPKKGSFTILLFFENLGEYDVSTHKTDSHLDCFFGVIGLMGIGPVAADQTYRDATLTGVEQRPLTFSPSNSLFLEHDDKQRATDAHIQLANADKPTTGAPF